MLDIVAHRGVVDPCVTAFIRGGTRPIIGWVDPGEIDELRQSGGLGGDLIGLRGTLRVGHQTSERESPACPVTR